MPAYIVFTREAMLDQAKYDLYAATAPAASAGHDITPLALYGEVEVLEGEPIEGVVMLQFPAMDAARAFYHSPAYQEAVQHRFRGARYRVFIADGLA